MSELLIRSEAQPEPAALRHAAALPFVPPASVPGPGSDDDDGDFAALLLAAGRGLSAMFGVPVTVTPGRPPAGDEVAAVAPVLAALLATVRLGGDIARFTPADQTHAGGIALARQAGAIADLLAGIAARVWPAAARRPFIDLDIAVGAIGGHARVAAPDRPAPAATRPVGATAARLLALPMRVRVELASELIGLSTLLPLRPGTVLPIGPAREMPLIVGDHSIGRATVAPLPDGRQAATVVTLAVEILGGSAR